MRRIVVVGASAAGLAAAEALRQEGFTGDLTIVGAEEHLPYNRPPLSKQLLTGAWPAERVLLRSRSRLDELGATWRLGVAATALDPARLEITLSDASALGYDGLVIATGVAARSLPHGHEWAGVHLLRGLDDAIALRAELVPDRRLVVIGAGFLGCEVAAVAARAGARVCMVDGLPGPLLRPLGSLVSEQVGRLHARNGVDLVAGVAVAGLTGHAGRVTGVRLSDGRTVPADAVVVAIGSTPNTGWLRGSGLVLTDGVDCDAHCRAAPHVVAAGDVASWLHPGLGRRIRVEHRTNAAEQGVAAARSLLGIAVEPFAPIPYFWSDQYDVKIQVHGCPDPGAEVSVVRGDPADGRFALTYTRDGVPLAVLTWNMPAAAIPLREEHLISSFGTAVRA